MSEQNALKSLQAKAFIEKLTADELACALYEGTAHLQNLAEKLARQHGQAEALTFYDMMGDDVRNFWRGIARQLIEHASEWQHNEGSSCVLSERERLRLSSIPRVTPWPYTGACPVCGAECTERGCVNIDCRNVEG